jgi:hypothetical protein
MELNEFSSLAFDALTTHRGQVEHQTVYSALAELPVDENGRLITHMLLVPQGCTTMDVPPTIEERVVGIADGDLADDLKLTDMCPSAVALEVGAIQEKLAEGYGILCLLYFIWMLGRR